MAILAQERRARFQQVGDGRAMRLVAYGAIFGHRLVVVYEGPALFHVALVAGLDYAASLHLLRVVPVHVMAVGAAHLAFKDRVAEGLVDLDALLLVAGETDLGLREFVAHFVVRGMNLVTGSARNFATGMNTGLPVQAPGIALVAGEADTVLGGRS